ncbi:WD domain, G-beta repeat-containing protein [Toxoplasma gondii TgCatPRC2]|uniref:Intraflagellar transport protein 122 homolog n=1 Tax=Toxoplasma gondii TgCatPRC2 TaxID=1130821 RepID=A0A151HCL4_TOXGO|nr:WD domain, G-beta repeat-containing protein [Toxoplasma gondii TgCatPRC2]
METRRLWYETVSSRDGSPSVIWSVAFSPDGSRLLVAVGSCLLVYDPVDAKVLQTLKAHKDTVYVVTYNKTGKLFASGGADRTVIVWTSPGAGWRKYSHSDSIQCLAFNPVTLQLASATSVDFGLWSPEVCSVGKQKLPARACCMDWTPNGNHLAIGLFSGIVSVRDTTGAEKWNVALSAPVWTLAWSPQQNEESFSIFLAVGTFCPELVFYRETGEACLPSQALDCDPLSISFALSGNFFLVGGSNGSISIWSHDGVRLGTIGQLQDWVWACAVHPNSSQIIAGSNAGELHMYNVTFPVVHALYQDRYAHRERLTDVVVQHMQLEQSVRIRCRSLVKKVAVFKESLAILLPGEVVLYSADQRNPDDMRYRETARIKHAFDCSLMLVTSSYLVRCTKAKLQLYSLAGTFEREWNLGSVIRYIKVVGGPPASEGILAGLKNGQVVEIFTNNPIPVTLVKQTHSIACLDISLQRTKLAAVDSTQRLTVYDLATKEVLYTESNVTSVAWNLVMDDMLAYTGNNTLSVRHGTLKPRSQRVQGLVVGFRGSKIYCLKSQSIQTCNFPQSASLYPYIGMKDFAAAYEVACLGVTASDWLSLALSALANLDFAYAAKAFTRLRDFRGITLVQKIQNSSSTAHKLSPVEQAHNAAAYVAAYQGNFDDAALHWVNAGQAHLAVEMFTELRRWEDAKKWAQTVDEGAVSAGCREPTLTRLPTAKDPPALGGNHENCTPETQNQRSTTNTTNLNQKEQVVAQQTATEEEKDDLIFAAEVYAKAKQLRRAVELYGRTGALDKIISIVRRELPAADAENILRAAFAVFKKHRHFAFAREASQKLGDKKLMARLLVEHGRWEEAFLFANQQPVVTDDVHIPWADYLVRSDRFDEATSALKKAGRPDLALGLQLKLLKICLEERRYLETSRRCWACAREILQGSDSNSGASVRGISSLCGHPSTPLSLFLFCTFRKLAEIYLAYHVVLRRKDEKLSSCLTGDLGRSILGLVSPLLEKGGPVPGVSQVEVLFALAETSLTVGAYKIGRLACQSLHRLRIPGRLQETIDSLTMILKSSPRSTENKRVLEETCSWCHAVVPLLNDERVPFIASEACDNCGHLRLREFGGFTVLGCIEFLPPPEVNDERAKAILNSTAIGKLDISHSSGHDLQHASFLTEEGRLPDGKKGNNLQARTPDPNAATISFMKAAGVTATSGTEGSFAPLRVGAALLRELPSDCVCILDHARVSPLLSTQYFFCCNRVTDERQDAHGSPPSSEESSCHNVLHHTGPCQRNRRLVVCGGCAHAFDLEKTEEFILYDRCCPLCGKTNFIA